MRYTLLLLIFSCLFPSLAAEPTQKEKASMTDTHLQQFSPAWPHGEIKPIFPNVFFVTGTNKTHHEGTDIQTSRNMTILRHGSELTLINTVRLTDPALKKLEALGSVTNIVRIGAFHGRDDAFYKHQYPKAKLWALKGTTYDSGLKVDQELVPNGLMPFSTCSIFAFKTSSQPECILHIDQEGGILVSCDSIQNITSTDDFYSSETAKSFHEMGLVASANISPIWLGATHTKASDFEELLKKFTFSHLLTGHGEPLMDNAYKKVSETVQRVSESEKKPKARDDNKFKALL
jgi:hypothetical protein